MLLTATPVSCTCNYAHHGLLLCPAGMLWHVHDYACFLCILCEVEWSAHDVIIIEPMATPSLLTWLASGPLNLYVNTILCM